MKLLFEIYRILRELGIKTKDIIGVGKKIQQTGKTLFNTAIDPKILKIIYDKGKLSPKLKNMITEGAKGLRDSNAIEKRKFLVNIRQIKNAAIPEEAEVIDIATRAKLPASGIEKLKTQVQIDKNVRPFKTGEARWILNKAVEEDLFAFKPEEIKIIKGGKGDIIELFRKYYGSNAVRNLPAEGSINAASKFADELKWAVDENGLLAKHPDFNKEAINWKLTRELVRDYSKKLDDHPYRTFTELKAEMPLTPGKVKGTFPRLDPDNDAFIILDQAGNKMGRYEGSVTADEVTGRSITKWWDKWDVENNKLFTDKSKYKFSGAMDDKGKDIITAEGVIEGGKSEIKKGIDDVMKDTSEAGLKKSIEIDNLKLEFPGITDEMIENILTDTNPQRIAEVKATMKEALMMREKGMSPEAIMKALEDAFKRPKQATGGRIGYEHGEMVLPQPKPEEVYLDQEIKRIRRAREMILKYKDAFTDKGEAMLDILDQEQALWRKKVLEHENIPGHATGGVSNLFRRR